MPSAPLCRHPGCPESAQDGFRHCDEHLTEFGVVLGLAKVAPLAPPVAWTVDRYAGASDQVL